MYPSKFKDFLKKKITSEEINLKEARKLGHVAELGDLNTKVLRSQRRLDVVSTPTCKSVVPIPLQPKRIGNLKSIRPEQTILFKKLSFEDIAEEISIPRDFTMAGFTIADFNRVIPEFKGDSSHLPVFLRRCDTFHDSLNDAGKASFLSHIIFKLSGKAFLIFEDKQYNDWPTLKSDLLEGIKVSKSASAVQNELVNLSQQASQSAKEFSETIKEKLKELSDIIKSQYDNAEVIKSFRIEHEKIAIRAFKEGLRPPLKYRVVNFEPKSLDEIVKKAVEEEPYVAVLKSSLDTKETDKPRPDNNLVDGNWREGRTQFQNSRQYQQHERFNNFNNNRRGWRPNRYSNARPATPFNNWRESNNNYSNRRNDERFPRREEKQTRYCIRCHRNGHTSDTCYAKLDQDNNKESPNVDNLSQRTKQVSFLEVPQTRRPLQGPDKPVWSNKIRNS